MTDIFYFLGIIVTGIIMFLVGCYICRWRSELRKPEEEPLPRPESSAYHKGVSYIIANKPDRAIAEFTKVVRLNPETVDVYLSLGNLFRQRGEVERAIRIHQSVLIRPTIPREIRILSLLALGADYQKGGFIDRAIATYDQVLGLERQNLAAYQHLKELYQEESNWERAYAMAQRIIRIKGSQDKKELSFIQMFWGKTLYEQKNYRQAIKHLKTTIYLYSECTPAYLILGDIYLAQAKPRKALMAWQEVVKQGFRHSFLAYSRLEEVYLQRQEYDHIGNLYRNAVAENPSNIRARLALANYYQRLGKKDAALEQFREALRYYPQARELQWQLWYLLVVEENKELLTKYQQLVGIPALKEPQFRCYNCGYETTMFPWRCPQCKKWDSFEDTLTLSPA